MQRLKFNPLMTTEQVYKQRGHKKEIKTSFGICIAQNIRHSGLGKWSVMTLETN